MTGNLYTLRQFTMARKFRTAAVQLKSRNPLKKGKQGVLVKPRKKSLVSLYAKLQGGEGGLGDIAEGGGNGNGGGGGGGAAVGETSMQCDEEEEEEEAVPAPAPKVKVRQFWSGIEIDISLLNLQHSFLVFQESAKERLKRKLDSSSYNTSSSYADDPIVRALGGLPDDEVSRITHIAAYDSV